MKKFSFILFILSIALLSGCKRGKAILYNNKITTLESSLDVDIKKAEKKVAEYFKNREWDKMDKVAKDMEDDVDDKISSLRDEQAPGVPGAEDFKKAAVKYFTFIKKTYTSYRKIAKAESDEGRLVEVENYKQIYNQRTDVSSDMKDAQREFAKANDLKLNGVDKEN